MDNLMDQISDPSKLEREPLDEPARRPRRRTWRTAAIGAAMVLAALLVYVGLAPRRGSQAVALSTPAPLVTVSRPLQREVDTRAGFLGQFSAIDRVELRAQVAGSRAATSPTTLLATLVSLDPLYLDFDMSESDFLTFSRERARLKGPLANKVAIWLSDENSFSREGTLDFIDNALDRSSGTIHARATVPNPHLFLAPGQFARLRVAIAPSTPVYLLPDAAVVLDQSQRLVMTVGSDATVKPKIVTTGDLRGGLRVIQSGLEPSDRVVIDGLVRAIPGTKVALQDGTIHYDPAADGQG